MSPIVKQTVKNKSIGFWKILAMIVGTVVAMNLAIGVCGKYGAVFGSTAAIGVLIICTMVCGIIIYKNLAYYNYRIIDDELMAERVIGRSNHIFLHINLNNVQFIKPYSHVDQNTKKIKTYKFVVDNNKDNWYVIQFLKDDKVNRLIIEPNENILKILHRYFNISEDGVISHS